MSISEKKLHEIHEDIVNEIETNLENARQEGSLLEEINSVIYGERRRIGELRTPAIWIVTEPHTPQVMGGHRTQHTFTFDFVTFVKANDAEKGLKQAQDIAMKTYDVFMEDRTLNKNVSDVVANRIDPAYEAGQSLQVYWSAVQFGFKLQRRE